MASSPTKGAGVKDIESGPATQPTDQAKQYHHIDTEKHAVYNKLMDHLDAVEQTHHRSSFTLILSELLVFSGLLAALVCSLTKDRINGRRFLDQRIWRYIAMAMMIASGLSVVRFVTFVVAWPIKRLWRIHKYAVYYICQLKRCVDVTVWFCIVLTGWYLWFRPRLMHVKGDVSMTVARQVTRFLIALCLGMWRFLYDKNSKKKLKKLRGSQKQLGRRDDGTTLDPMKGENIWMLVKEMDKGSVPIRILRRLEEEYLDQVKLHPLPGSIDVTKDDQKILREVKKMFRLLVKNQIQNNNWDNYSDHEIKRKDLSGENYFLKKEELDFIFNSRQEDEDDEESEAEATSSKTPTERNISYDEFLNWAVRAYKNCWGLERTLKNSKRVFVKLNRLLTTFLLVVVLIIWLLLSGIVDTGQLALLFSPFVAASFIFGDSFKKMFEGLIFAFAMHPFDVGDRVIINNVQMRVTNLKILTSCFHKYDTGEEVIVPNSTLTTTNIVNLDITPDQSDKVEFVIDAQTPLEDINDLEIKIKKFLDDDIEYSSDNKVVKSEIGKEEIKMTVYFKYLVSYLSAESKAVHKSKILSMIIKFRKNMEMKMEINSKQPYPSSYQPYIVKIEFTEKRKLKLKDIEDIQAEIMRCIKERYKPCSKVVLKEVTKSGVKMGLYIHYFDPTKKMWSEDKEDESEIETHDLKSSKSKWAILIDKQKDVMKNLDHIIHTLRQNEIVKDVRIQIDGEDKDVVITQSAKGWKSVKASDVVQTQDNSAQQQQGSGDVKENKEAREGEKEKDLCGD